MSNNNAKDFLKAVKQNNETLLKNYKPKFQPGDVIMNHKFKVISIVTGFAKTWPTIRDKNTGHAMGSGPNKTLHYVLKDLENKAAQAYFGKAGMILDKENRKRYKEVKPIDKTYVLIDPVKAQLLFGKEIIDLREKYLQKAFK